jgi:excisionase family DNA binding protein
MIQNLPSRLLTKEELAERINQPPLTINRLRREGVIPAVRFGYRNYRYDLEKVMAALKRLEIGAVAVE